jgi:hypothetical protein
LEIRAGGKTPYCCEKVFSSFGGGGGGAVLGFEILLVREELYHLSHSTSPKRIF